MFDKKHKVQAPKGSEPLPHIIQVVVAFFRTFMLLTAVVMKALRLEGAEFWF